MGRPEIAATIYGVSVRIGSGNRAHELAGLLADLRSRLGRTGFDDCAAIGAAMETGDGVRYVRQQIQLARQQLGVAPDHPQRPTLHSP
jgi:hypothetical protein